MSILKNKVQKGNLLQSNNQNLFFSDSDGQREQQADKKQYSSRKSQNLTDQQLIGMSHIPKRYQQQIQQKHGKFITKRQKKNYQNKSKENLYQKNPYNSMVLNTNQQSQWKNKMKSSLTSQQYLKLKQHFLRVIFMATRGQTPRYTLRDLGKQFNLTDDLVQQVKSKFQNDMDLAKYSKLFGGENNHKSIIQTKKKQDILVKLIVRNPFMNSFDISEKLKKLKQPFQITPQQIQSILNDEGYYLKSLNKYPKSRNNQANRERRKVFCQKINFIKQKTSHKMYFLGICKFYNHMFRDRGWTQEEYLIQPQMQEGFSLMAVTQINGQGTWKFQKQIHQQKIFQQTLKKLLELLLKKNESLTQLKYLIFDFKYWLKYNSILNKIRKQFNLEMLWIPPFSAPLNPLEFWFQQIIKNLKASGRLMILEESKEKNILSQSQTSNKEQFIKQIYEQLCKIFKQKYNLDFDFTRFVEYSQKYYLLGTEKELF